MKPNTLSVLLSLALAVLALGSRPGPVRAAPPAASPGVGAESLDNGVRVLKDIPYEGVADPNRTLTLYLPPSPSAPKLPVVVLIHGGGWSGGDKNDFNGVAEEFVQRGYAAASLNYRLSQQAIFPAQIIDCKAAIRWLRAHAGAYGLDAGRVVAGGHSAGGHLAALVGTTGDVSKFDVGPNLGQKSNVQAVLWFAGVGDLVSRTLIPGYEGEQDAHSGESGLVGGPVLQTTQVAYAASPITYVDAHTPPFAIFHGDSDRVVPVAQAIEMDSALLRAGVPAELHIIKGADHGGPGYFTPLMFDQIDTFLDKTLGRSPLAASDPPLRDGGSYRLSPVTAPGLVMGALGSGTTNMTSVILAPPVTGVIGASGQAWTFHAHGDGSYVLRPSFSQSLALSVTPGSTANTTRVILLNDEGQPYQLWQIHRDRDGRCLLTPQIAPGSALDDLGGSTTPGSPVDIFSSGGYDPHLLWHVTPVP